MLKPDMYRKDIFNVDFSLLKKQGVKVLLFDLDNTLINNVEFCLNEKTKNLLNDLKKEFYIAIVSNTLSSIKAYSIKNDYNIEIIICSMKPFGVGFRKLPKLSNYKKEEICMIGDQMLTDVLSAKRKGFKSVFLDYIEKDIEPITRFSRHFEKYILKINNIKRGEYF